MGKKIIWTNHAIAGLNESFLELLEQSQSIETTIRVIDEVHESTSILATDPEIYKADTLRKGNKGNIRSYEKHSYRISYLIENEAFILSVFATQEKNPWNIDLHKTEPIFFLRNPDDRIPFPRPRHPNPPC